MILSFQTRQVWANSIDPDLSSLNRVHTCLPFRRHLDTVLYSKTTLLKFLDNYSKFFGVRILRSFTGLSKIGVICLVSELSRSPLMILGTSLLENSHHRVPAPIQSVILSNVQSIASIIIWIYWQISPNMKKGGIKTERLMPYLHQESLFVPCY